MVEPSNITIGIVSDVSGGGWRRKAFGWFLEFRTIPVLLWSYTSVALGTALAFLDGGRIELVWFLVAMALAGLVQGWVTHAINEIFDWRSGTDRDRAPRALSGGSKVLNLRLLTERDLWLLFLVSTAAVAGLAILVGTMRAPWLVVLIATGYALGLVYTLPPISTAYRPVAGEFLGGFPGVLLAGLGAYGIQTLRLSWTAALALSAHAFVCTAMLVMHHYIDAGPDAGAVPVKRTTVVALGAKRARTYASGLATAGAITYGVAGALVHPAFFVGSALTFIASALHARTDPANLRSVTRNELRIVQLGIAAGLSVAVAIAPPLWPLVPVAALGYFVHLAAVAPPRGLARAWRSAPYEGDGRAR